MSRWTHRICADCWIRKEVEHAERTPEPYLAMPSILKQDACPEEEDCCFCGATLFSPANVGIYVRHNPEELRCKGEHASE